jgi:hypothetical protein
VRERERERQRGNENGEMVGGGPNPNQSSIRTGPCTEESLNEEYKLPNPIATLQAVVRRILKLQKAGTDKTTGSALNLSPVCLILKSTETTDKPSNF